MWKQSVKKIIGVRYQFGNMVNCQIQGTLIKNEEIHNNNFCRST